MSPSGHRTSLIRIAALVALALSTPANDAVAEPLALAEPAHCTTAIFDQVVRAQRSTQGSIQDTRNVADPRLRRQIVDFSTAEAPGAIIIDVIDLYGRVDVGSKVVVLPR